MKAGHSRYAAWPWILAAVLGTAWLSACTREERTTETRIEVHEESPPEMVSPGEMIVE